MDEYTLDTDPEAAPSESQHRPDRSDRTDDAGDASAVPDERLGLPVPGDHVGAFVAETFEDPERSTAWPEAVDAMVAEEARDAWERLDPAERVAEVLERAGAFDDRATHLLDGIPIDRGSPTGGIEAQFEDALRLRRNADTLRDAVADAYARGVVDDESLVAAVERADFDTGLVAVREERLERVVDAYGFDYRPYGGTLFDADGGRGTTDAGGTLWGE